MARMYNRYGASDKNVLKFKSEIVTEVNGQKVGDDVLVIKCSHKSDVCHLTFIPNFADKTIGLALDVTTKFSDAVLEYMIKSGDAQKIMSEIYLQLGWDKLQPKQVELDIPTLDLPVIQGTFGSYN